MSGNLSNIASMLDSIVVFSGIRDGEVLTALRTLLVSERDRVRHYSEFVSELFRYDYNFTNYLLVALAEDENEYVKLRGRGEDIQPVLARCVDGELDVFQRLSELTSASLREFTGYNGYLPEFETSRVDIKTEYEKRVAAICENGYGIYARHTMFRVTDGEIVPLRSPDLVDIGDLVGYEDQRGKLIENTKALLRGLPAANALLVGDAGTGKSTSVKAIANLFAPRGLRLIEMHKEQLRQIPIVMEKLRDNPLKFILFIDDLSFSKNDDSFSALKATLEGSATVKAKNVVIYATSNRRHLVKETFSDREGDDVHRGDTIQELNSLAERFWLTILYTRPAKSLYLEIVHGLCARKGIDVTDALDVEASAYALRKGGMSPRAAEQFTDSVLARVYKEERN